MHENCNKKSINYEKNLQFHPNNVSAFYFIKINFYEIFKFFSIDMTKWRSLENEEKTLREENVRLQRKLNMEVERREALHRQLSESETSLEMEEER